MLVLMQEVSEWRDQLTLAFIMGVYTSYIHRVSTLPSSLQDAVNEPEHHIV